MSDSLKEIAPTCAIAKLDAELMTIKRQRSEQEASELAAYVASADFERRSALVKQSVLATMARCKPMVLRQVADELRLPLDAAAAWVAIEIALPLGETLRISVVDEKESA